MTALEEDYIELNQEYVNMYYCTFAIHELCCEPGFAGKDVSGKMYLR